MVFEKTKSLKIDFVGNFISQSTAYFCVIILNFIFIPIIEINIKKNFSHEGRFPILQISSYHAYWKFKIDWKVRIWKVKKIVITKTSRLRKLNVTPQAS